MILSFVFKKYRTRPIFFLSAVDLSTVEVKSGRRDGDGFPIPVEFVHHNYDRLVSTLNLINVNYPNITRLYTVGKSVQGRHLYVLEVSTNPGKHEPGNFHLSRRITVLVQYPSQKTIKTAE